MYNLQAVQEFFCQLRAGLEVQCGEESKQCKKFLIPELD